jgi:hypothetical protein
MRAVAGVVRDATNSTAAKKNLNFTFAEYAL